jgi:hypothetical protein
LVYDAIMICTSPRNLGRSFRLFAAALALGAGSLGVPGCFLVESQQDCEKSCDMLNQCGVLASGSCGTYCAALVAGVTIAGCGDEFDAQNDCGKSLTECTDAATKCEKQVKAFATCMDEYCKKTPNGQGCP